MHRIANYINGQSAEPASGSYLDDFDPATGNVWAQLPDGDDRDVQRAVEAAEGAFPEWSATPAHERSRILLRIAELIEHGTLRPGERVPSVRRCSEQQNVSIATVTQAYRLLQSRGVIEARPQSGYYVRREKWSPPPEPEMYRPARRAIVVGPGSVNDLTA